MRHVATFAALVSLSAGVCALKAATAAAQVAGGSPAPPAAGDLVSVGSITVTGIDVQGSSVFSLDELAAFTAPYTDRAVSLEELHELRHALSRAYVERGYVSSGVVIPDQRIGDGRVVLEAVEGKLAGIEIHGNRRLRDRAIERRVQRHIRTPLDIGDLQTGLRILREEPQVERVNAQLLPGERVGESRLRLAITERPPFELEVSAGNDRSPSVGEDRGTVAVTYRGLLGNGDALSGRFGITQGVEDNALTYSVPVNTRGTVLDVFLADQEADIVEEPFDSVDIKSELRSWSLTASHPFVRETAGALVGFIGFEHKRSESSLLGLPFSFSPGDVEGRAKGSMVSLGMEWTRRRSAHALAVRGTLQMGVDALDATVHPVGPDARSRSVLGQVQYARTIRWRDSRLLLRGLMQIARDPLLAMYKLPVGGRFSVRGYRENQFVRDNGATASVEYQFPPLVDEAGRARGNFNIAVFADYGVSWDEDDALVTAEKADIASVGLGLLWDPIPRLHTEIYWGADLDEQNRSSETLQDQGFHYRISFSRIF